MGQVARQLSQILGADRLDDLVDVVGIGDSGSKFARYINPGAPSIPVTTVSFDRDRWLRKLSVEPVGRLPDKPIICDDVFISGATVCSVISQLRITPQLVTAGLSYNSKTARRRLGVPVIEGLRYGRIGGGCPPMNSASTLVSDRGQNVLENLSNKYFQGKSKELKEILERL